MVVVSVLAGGGYCNKAIAKYACSTYVCSTGAYVLPSLIPRPIPCSMSWPGNKAIGYSRQVSKKVYSIPQEKDLAGHSVAMLQTVASIVACGELPTLFSNDEMDGLLQVCVAD